MTGLLQNLITSFPKTISKVLTSGVDKSRLQSINKSHAEHNAGAHVWDSAHSEQKRNRSRIVVDAAMNHWFVCNKGVVNRNAPLIYDPFGNIVQTAGKDLSLAKFDRLWDRPMVTEPHPELNEHDDFWKDFNQCTRPAENRVASTHFTDAKCEKVKNDVRQFSEDPVSKSNEYVPLEQLYTRAEPILRRRIEH